MLHALCLSVPVTVAKTVLLPSEIKVIPSGADWDTISFLWFKVFVCGKIKPLIGITNSSSLLDHSHYHSGKRCHSEFSYGRNKGKEGGRKEGMKGETLNPNSPSIAPFFYSSTQAIFYRHSLHSIFPILTSTCSNWPLSSSLR